jgi:hypothetical protein
LPAKATYTVPGVWQSCSEFSGFGDGLEAMQGGGNLASEEISDRLRQLVEASDSVQGEQGLV